MRGSAVGGRLQGRGADWALVGPRMCPTKVLAQELERGSRDPAPAAAAGWGSKMLFKSRAFVCASAPAGYPLFSGKSTFSQPCCSRGSGSRGPSGCPRGGPFGCPAPLSPAHLSLPSAAPARAWLLAAEQVHKNDLIYYRRHVLKQLTKLQDVKRQASAFSFLNPYRLLAMIKIVFSFLKLELIFLSKAIM